MQETIGLLSSCYFHYIHPCIRIGCLTLFQVVCLIFLLFFTSFYGSFQCSKRWMLRSFTLNKCQHHSQPSVRRPRLFQRPYANIKHTANLRDFTALFFGIVKSIASEPPSHAKVYRGYQNLSLAPTRSFPDTHFKLDGLVGFRLTHLRVLHENHPIAATGFETLRPWHLWQSYYQLVDRYEHPVHKDLDTNVQ